MANKKNKGNIPQPATKANIPLPKKEVMAKPANNGFNLVDWVKTNPYAPGILLFLFTFIIGVVVYKDYGMCWDEPAQKGPGLLSYDFIFNGSDELFQKTTDNHGAGFELLLVFFEKWFNITDSKAIYEMRHLVTHIVFLLGSFAGYVLAYRLFKNRFIASLGFVMLAFAPRMYAHSFFNSKDIPFLSMFLITMMLAQVAFEKNKKWLFVLLGLACGYATSIRIMGVMLAGIIGAFLVIDIVSAYIKKDDKANKTVINLLLFMAGCCFMAYIAWPYLWRDPVHNFVDSFTKLSHFNLWTGIMLLGGKYVSSMNLPWTYFPTWFLISNPILWLIAGFAGIVLVIIAFFSKPLLFLRNTTERNFIMYLLSFAGPILAVILMHSIIYDDWRHLYFVYPSFVLLGLYFVNKIYNTKGRNIIIGACVLQVALISFFMVSAHPFQEVYFNEFVSHDKESLRKNYEMDYWGPSFRQGLEHLIKTNPTGTISVYTNFEQLVINNVLMLNEQDRNRIQITPDRDRATFIITNYRNHPHDYPITNVDYSIKVLNSTILSIFKQDPDLTKRKQELEQEIATLKQSVAANPTDHFLHSTLGDAFFWDKQYDSATAHYMRALELKPNFLAIIDFAGEYFMRGRYPEAIIFCKKAIELTPNDINAFNNIGLCYMRLTKFDSAVIYLQKATVIDPESARAYQNLAFTYRAMGKPDSAKKYEVITQKFNPEFKLNQ